MVGDFPDLAGNLHQFDQQYGLPDPPSLTRINQLGGTTLPPSGVATPWDLEANADVQWVHALAPAANILVVEAQGENTIDILETAATAAAQPGVSVVSMSLRTAIGLGLAPLTDPVFTTPPGHQGGDLRVRVGR